jgi:hypothetical protein
MLGEPIFLQIHRYHTCIDPEKGFAIFAEEHGTSSAISAYQWSYRGEEATARNSKLHGVPTKASTMFFSTAA